MKTNTLFVLGWGFLLAAAAAFFLRALMPATISNVAAVTLFAGFCLSITISLSYE